MNELVSAYCDRDVAGTRSDCREEQQIAGLDLVAVHRPTGFELVADLPRHAEAVPGEHVLHEPAAIEPGGIAATISIRNAREREGRSGDRVAILDLDRPDV